MARREVRNREREQPFEDERGLEIGREDERAQRRKEREAAHRRRHGGTGSEPSVPGTDAVPETTDTSTSIAPDAVPEAGHDVPVDVPHGETAAQEGEQTDEANVPAGAGSEITSPATEAVSFNKGDHVRISDGHGGFDAGWEVQYVSGNGSEAQVYIKKTVGQQTFDHLIPLDTLRKWQEDTGVPDVSPGVPEGADDAGGTTQRLEDELARSLEEMSDEELNAERARLYYLKEETAEDTARAKEIDRILYERQKARTASPQAPAVPDTTPPAETPKPDDGTERKARFGMFDDGELRRMAATLREKIEKAKPNAPNRAELATNLAAVQNELRLRSEERRQGKQGRAQRPAAGRFTGTETNQRTPSEAEAQKTGLEQFAEKLDDPAFLEQLRTGSAADVDGYETQLDDAYATVQAEGWKENTQREYQRLKAKLADLRQERWQAEAAAQAEAEKRQAAERHREHTPQLDEAVNEARAAYAKALRTKVHAFIGVKKDEEVNRLHDEYVQAMDARLQHTIDMVKRGFEGKDLTDPDVQKKLGDRLIWVTQAGRLREETAFRRDLREANEKKASRWIQKALAKSAKARLWTGLAMTGSAIALGFFGRGELAAAIQAARTPLGIAGSVTMADAAWQLIESSHGAMKKRTQAEIDAMNDPDEIRKILAAHEWKYARFMTQEFGNRSEFHLPKFDRTAKLKIRRHEATYDETGKMLMARYDLLMRERIQQDIRTQLQQTGGNVDQAVAGRAKHYAVRQEELGSLRERGKKERRMAIGKIIANTLAGIASALTINRFGHHGHKPEEPQGEFLGHRMGIPVDENDARNMGMPVDGHGVEHAGSAATSEAPGTAVPDTSHVDTSAVPDTSHVDTGTVPDTSTAAGHAPVPEAAGHADLYAGQDADATIRAEDGIEHALRRQLEHFDVAKQFGYTGPDNHDALHAWSGGEAHRIALHNSITDPATGIEHSIIDVKTGTEQWVYTPGTNVYLNVDGSVTVDHPSDLYTHAAYHPDTGHAAAHVPQPESAVPEAAAPGSVLPLDTTPHDVLQQTIHDAYYPSDAGAPTDGTIIGPDSFVPDALHGAPSGVVPSAAPDSLPHGDLPHSDVHGLHDIGSDTNADVLLAGAAGAVGASGVAAREALLRPQQKRYEKTYYAVGELKKVDAQRASEILSAIGSMRMRDIANEASISEVIRSEDTPKVQQAVREVSTALWTLLHNTDRGVYKPEDTVAAVVKRVTSKSKLMDLGAELE